MPNVYLIKGKGSFTDNEGKTTTYPVEKLVISNGESDVEIKLDKIAKKLIPYLFSVTDTGVKTEDENGVECKLFRLDDPGTVNVKSE